MQTEKLRYSILFAVFVNVSFSSAQTLDHSIPEFFHFRWNNDIFYFPDQTDYYFSNGFDLELSLAAFRKNPVNGLLVPKKARDGAIFGIHLIQNIYTPVEKDTLALQLDDRPFASYLTLGFTACILEAERGWKWAPELQVGVLGRWSGGEQVQNFFHRLTPQNEEVAGWVNQLRDGFLLNYNLTVEKSLLREPFLQIWARGTGRLGSLYTDLSPGFRFRLGRWDDYFVNPPGWVKSRKFNYVLGGGAWVRAVVYDATLTGSFFRKDDRFHGVTKPEPIQFQGQLFLGLRWRSFTFRYLMAWYSPEFEGGRSHHFGQFGISHLW